MTDSLQQTIVIESRLDCVAELGRSINAFCAGQGLDEMARFQVQTAATEAINNAILHAYDNNPRHRVTVNCSVESDMLMIEVIDQGRKLQQLPPDIEPPAEAESGRGWWIMRRWMDRVEYSSSEGVNRLRLYRRV